MAKKLFLVRHTQAVENTGRQTDVHRALTARGFSDASRIGGKFIEKHQKPDIIISSHAERARRTAELMAEQMKFDHESIIYDEDLYEASARTLLNLINALSDSWSRVILIGHNPSFSYFAEFITKQNIGSIQPGGIVEIDFQVGAWREISEANAQLKSYDVPLKEQE